MTNTPVLTTYASIVSTFTSFLTVAIHTIIYERGIYPSNTFLSARKYNFPVRQNQHPKVCKWINDAVAAVEIEMLKVDALLIGSLSHPFSSSSTSSNCSPHHGNSELPTIDLLQGTVFHVAVVIHDARSQPLERFLFDVSSFPNIPPSEVLTAFEASSPSPSQEATPEEEQGASQDSTAATTQAPKTTNVVDLEEQFRGVMRKLAFCSSSLRGLPDGCSFTVCVELKDEAKAPIGHPQPWIPSQPSLQPATTDGSLRQGKDVGGIKTTPVRAVEAGEFVMELWIEEAKAKQESRVENADPN
ncbi:MAG: hypothetical protein M1837_007400 [Sclerophora amabilis]|nr:MAG: hypothetical protein M1837_007400 [Sclerophora amabilis]